MPQNLTTRSDDTPSEPDKAVEVLLVLGTLLISAGSTAVRTHVLMRKLATKLGFSPCSVSLTIDSITVSIRHRDGWTTAMREIGLPAVNVARIEQLERLAGAKSELTPEDIAGRLAEIEAAPRLYATRLIAPGIGAASAGFAFLNGCAGVEIVAAGVGGGIGQWLRFRLSGKHFNQFGTAALCATVASGCYVLVAGLASHIGFGPARYSVGLFASALFLVPGFPLIAALFDLLHHQTVAAVSRLAYALMLLLGVAFGLSVVIAVTRIDLAIAPVHELTYPQTLMFRAVASFVAACAFAMLFNNSQRTVLAAGLLALVANEMRLVLHDFGVMLAPAAFLASMMIGVAALLIDRHFALPRFALVVPPIIIMIPGVSAYQSIAFFNQGQLLDALQAFVACAFIVGALVFGLAAARLLETDRP